MGLSVTEFVGLIALTACFCLLVAGGFMIGALAGVFVLAGLLGLTGASLLVLADARERKARELGQHASGSGGLRSAA